MLFQDSSSSNNANMAETSLGWVQSFVAGGFWGLWALFVQRCVAAVLYRWWVAVRSRLLRSERVRSYAAALHTIDEKVLAEAKKKAGKEAKKQRRQQKEDARAQLRILRDARFPSPRPRDAARAWATGQL
ncbi:hypothetical protein PG994_014539 [Apiospora phragmitis]|uniref:Uncharacterized protein n=1 Tax=Apiospora phragmitis TaxID=2905665 RepID=A0ABR1T4M5_9PEZI